MYELSDFFEGSVEASEVPSTLFAEAADNLVNIGKSFDAAIRKADMILESVEREYNLNISRAELKCMREKGTVDDMMYLEEAAGEGAITKFKKMIDKIIQMWKDFCTKIRNKVMSKICSAKARQTLNKVEKKVKLNPFLARKKIEVMNNKKALGVIKKYKSQLDKVAAKAIKGLGPNEHTSETLMETKDEFRSQFNKAISGKAGSIMLTVSAVVAQLNTEIDRLPQFVDNCEKVNSATLEKLKATVSEDAAAAATAATQACMNFRTELAKEELNQHISYIMDLMSALRKAVLKAKGKTEAEMVKESAEDDLFVGFDEGEDMFDEGADDDAALSDDAFLDSILND